MKNVGDVIKAMNSGKIRTFKEQSDAAAARKGNATPLEFKARIVYIGYIMSTENPILLP